MGIVCRTSLCLVLAALTACGKTASKEGHAALSPTEGLDESAKTTIVDSPSHKITYLSDGTVKIDNPSIANLPVAGHPNVLCKSLDPSYLVGVFDIETLRSEQDGAIGQLNGSFLISKIKEKFSTVLCINPKKFVANAMEGSEKKSAYWFRELGDLTLHVGDRSANLAFTDSIIKFQNDRSRPALFKSACSLRGYPLHASGDLSLVESTSALVAGTTLLLDYSEESHLFKVVDFDQWGVQSKIFTASTFCSNGQLVQEFMKSEGKTFAPEIDWVPEKVPLKYGFLRGLNKESFLQFERDIKLPWPWRGGQQAHLLKGESEFWAPSICSPGLPLYNEFATSTGNGSLAIIQAAPRTPTTKVSNDESILIHEPYYSRHSFSRIVCMSLPSGYAFKYTRSVIEENAKSKKTRIENPRIESPDGQEKIYFDYNDAYSAGVVCELLGVNDTFALNVISAKLSSPLPKSYIVEWQRKVDQIRLKPKDTGSYVQALECKQNYSN